MINPVGSLFPCFTVCVTSLIETAMFKIGRKNLQENFPHSKLKQYTLLKFIFEDESDYMEFL